MHHRLSAVKSPLGDLGVVFLTLATQATHMKTLLLSIITFFFNQHILAQTIINGSFENTSGGCQHIANATYNSSMQNSVGFGTASQLDIMDAGCGYGTPQNGSWMVGMACDINGTMTDAFSLALSAPLVIGNSYTLTYYDSKNPTYATNPVEIGISTSSTAFGTQVYLSPTPTTTWAQRTVTFTATVAATYITAHVVGNAYSWTHVDDFVLTPNGTPATTQIVDSCFTSAASGTSFFGSSDLQNGDADLMEWTGSAWTGAWTGANVTLPPPSNTTGCRAMFIGNDSEWTTGGESFSLRLSQPLVAGQQYSFDFTYVSHGQYSYGSFAPYIYTNNTSSLSGAYSLGQMPAVGTSWTTNTISFTATGSQAGNTWLIIGTIPSGNTGLVLSLCSTCNVPQVPSTLQMTATPTYATCYGVCNGSATATATGGTPPYYYLWQSSGDTTATTTGLCAGNTYYITVTDSLGTSLTSSVSLPVVNPLSVTITSDAPGICAGNTATLCATQNFVSYSWSTGDTTECISTSQPGTYTVTVSNANNCTAESNQFILTSGTLPADTIHANQTVFCASDSAQICATSGFSSYLWNTGATTGCISTSLAGNYYVTVTDANGCTAESNHLAITVHQLPPVSISVNGDTLNAYNAVSYQWYLNGNLIGGANTGIYIANQAGSYSVEVTDTNGCSAISNPINVTGISELRNPQSAIRIFPNPNSTGNWQLQVTEAWLGSKVEVFDAEGRLVFKSEISIPNSALSFDAATGVYVMHIYNQEQNASVKLVKNP